MKKVLIMGASSGIGRRVAEEFASRGIIVGAAARNLSALQTLKDLYPDTIEIEEVDITK